MEIPAEKRIKRKRKLPGENKDDICQTNRQEVKRNLYPYLPTPPLEQDMTQGQCVSRV